MVELDEGGAFARAVGYVLRTERQRRRWTLAETGQKVGLSVSVLCRLELGARPLDVSRLAGLCAALGVAPARVIALAQDDAFPLGWCGSDTAYIDEWQVPHDDSEHDEQHEPGSSLGFMPIWFSHDQHRPGENMTDNTAGPDEDTQTRGTARPWTPASAQPERRSIDGKGTLYAPTSLSLDSGAFIEDTCPMDFEVTDEGTYFLLGDTNSTLSVAFSDLALCNIARLAIHALRAMLRVREDADLETRVLNDLY